MALEVVKIMKELKVVLNLVLTVAKCTCRLILKMKEVTINRKKKKMQRENVIKMMLMEEGRKKIKKIEILVTYMKKVLRN